MKLLPMVDDNRRSNAVTKEVIMKTISKAQLFVLSLLLLLTCGMARTAPAQEQNDAQAPADCTQGPNFGNTVPLWAYKIKATRGDKGMYEGVIVGTCPFDKDGKTKKTSIKTFRVWVKVTIQGKDGPVVFDPTTPNPCLKDGDGKTHSVLEVAGLSPIFQSFGKNDGSGNGYNNLGDDDVLQGGDGKQIKLQYADFFQRANFWTVVNEGGIKGGKSSYQTVLSPVDDIIVNAPAVPGQSAVTNGPCGPAGWIEYSAWESMRNTIYTNDLKKEGVTAAAFPIFLLDSVQVCFEPFNPPENCIPGYHSAVDDGAGNKQTFAFADFDNSGLITGDSGDVNTLSHEVGEWMDDPIVDGWDIKGIQGGNPTPKWGDGIGQVKKGECQANLEVGDPLSQAPPKLNPWTIKITQPFNYSYHMQELAYFSWFFGKPSVGAGGNGERAAVKWFSNKGTFTDAAPELKIAECKPSIGP